MKRGGLFISQKACSHSEHPTCSVSRSVWVFSALSLLKGIRLQLEGNSVTEAYGPFLGVKPQVYINSGATCWWIFLPLFPSHPISAPTSSDTPTLRPLSHHFVSSLHNNTSLTCCLFPHYLTPRVAIKPLIPSSCWNKWCSGRRLADKYVIANAINSFDCVFEWLDGINRVVVHSKNNTWGQALKKDEFVLQYFKLLLQPEPTHAWSSPITEAWRDSAISTQ